MLPFRGRVMTYICFLQYVVSVLKIKLLQDLLIDLLFNCALSFERKLSIMAPFPGNHIRNYLRSGADLKVADDSSDVLLNLDYELFVKDLIKEAERLSEKDGAHEILPAHIMRAKEVSFVVLGTPHLQSRACANIAAFRKKLVLRRYQG